MKKKVSDVIAEEGTIEEMKSFIDLTILMSIDEEIIKHVPTLRLIIQ